MDNRTLLIALDFVLLTCTIFSLIIGGRSKARIGAWQFASILSLGGFLLISFQLYLPSLVTIIIANLCIVLGVYAQVLAALRIDDHADRMSPLFFPILITIYLGFYLYFTYIVFSTGIRVIVLSTSISIISGYGAFTLIPRSPQERGGAFHLLELIALFIITALFFVLRACVTVVNDLSMSSLIEANISTSIAFLFSMLQQLVFFMGMATASLRKKNNQLQTDKKRFQYLFSFLNDTAKLLDLEELYKRIGRILTQTLSIDSGGIYLFDEDRKGLTLSYVINYLNSDTSGARHLDRDDGLIWQAMDRDEVVTMDLRDYPANPLRAQMMRIGIKYLAFAPIKSIDGVMGGMVALFASRETYVSLDRGLFYYLGEQIGLVLHNALMYGEVSSIAHTDMLTGLYTRRKFFEILTAETRRSKRYSHHFCIAMADMDKFKEVNDTAGHDCGDRLLQLAASIFIRECRDTDFVCRWGGEEFMFLFLNTELQTALPITERIRASFEAASCQCGASVTATISIGLTQSELDVPLDRLLKKVDELLYDAKRAGRNRVVSGTIIAEPS